MKIQTLLMALETPAVSVFCVQSHRDASWATKKKIKHFIEIFHCLQTEIIVSLHIL